MRHNTVDGLADEARKRFGGDHKPADTEPVDDSSPRPASEETVGDDSRMISGQPVFDGAQSAQRYARIRPPEVEDAPGQAVREDTPGYIAKAFPKLFPFGTGDFHELRQHVELCFGGRPFIRSGVAWRRYRHGSVLCEYKLWGRSS